MNTVTEPEKNSLITKFSFWFPGVIIVGVLAFVRHKSDFDSLVFKLSMEASTVIVLFLGLLQMKNVIVVPSSLKDKTLILNLIEYFIFAAIWYGVFLFLENILPGIAPPEKLPDLVHSIEQAVLILATLLLFLSFRDIGKRRPINVPKWNAKLVTIIIIACLITVAVLSFLFPSPSDKYRDHAMHFMRQHDYQAALASMNQAIQECDKDSHALAGYYSDRAYAYDELGKYKEAIYDLAQSIDAMNKNKAADTNPFELASLFLRRGNDYLILGDYQNAIYDYSHVLHLDPKNGSTYYNRSIAYEKLGKHDLAVQDQEKFKELGFKPQENKMAPRK